MQSGAEQYKKYAEIYLSHCIAPAHWLAAGLRAGVSWSPCEDERLNRVWRWYVYAWWDGERERDERARWLSDAEFRVVRFEPTPERERVAAHDAVSTITSATKRPSAPVPPAALDAMIEHLDDVLEDFDARMAAIAERVRSYQTRTSAAPEDDTSEFMSDDL